MMGIETQRVMRSTEAPLSHAESRRGELTWTAEAPRKLRKTGAGLGEGATWRAWVKHLNKRRRRGRFVMPGNEDRLKAGLQTKDCLTRTRKRVPAGYPAELQTLDETELSLAGETWLEGGATHPSKSPETPDSLAWCHALPALAERLPADLWQRLLSRLRSLAAENPSRGVDANGDISISENDEPSAAAAQLHRAELGLTLAWLFPELQACAELGAVAVCDLGKAISSLSGQGSVPTAELRGQWLPLLVRGARCLQLCRELKLEGIKPARAQFSDLVLNALRLRAGRGEQLLGANTGAGTAPLRRRVWKEIVGVCRNRKLAAAARLTLGRKNSSRRSAMTTKKSTASLKGCGKLQPTLYERHTGLAVLRSNWLPDSAALAVEFHGQGLHLELRHGHTLLHGVWHTQVCVAGRAAAPAADWRCRQWVSDKRVDYLEIEQAISGDLLVRQQWLLPREEDFLFAATEVHAHQRQALELSVRLPLAAGIAPLQTERTTELTLTSVEAASPPQQSGEAGAAHSQAAMILPLAFSEWRSGRQNARWNVDGQTVTIQTTQSAVSLYLPLFIDLRPKRFAKQVTWRRLTVAENRMPVTGEMASGYRVQSGNDQWAFYRALATSGNRTLLGINTSKQFLAARFLHSGKYKPLLELG